ncbi:hypothetical protein ACSQ67_022063 [Phaseolus vulgaris]
MIQIPTLQPLAVSTLLSSFVAVTTIKREHSHCVTNSWILFVVGVPRAVWDTGGFTCQTCHSQYNFLWYYELGPDDPPYAAKFYDCCGAEDPEASGCTTSFHVSYDEE